MSLRRVLLLAAALTPIAAAPGPVRATDWISYPLLDMATHKQTGWHIALPATVPPDSLGLDKHDLRELLPSLKDLPSHCGPLLTVTALNLKENRSPEAARAGRKMKGYTRFKGMLAQRHSEIGKTRLRDLLVLYPEGISITVSLEMRSSGDGRACMREPFIGALQDIVDRVASTAAKGHARTPDAPASRRAPAADGVAIGSGGAPGKKPAGGTKRKAMRELADAMVLLKAGALSVADARIAAAMAEDPDSPDVQLANALLRRLYGEPAAEKAGLDAAKAAGADVAARVAFLLRVLAPKDGRGLPPYRKVPDGLARGLAEQWSGNREMALTAYDIALDNDPKHWLALALRGLLKLDLNDCKGARADLREAVRKNTNFTLYAFKGYAELCGAGTPPQ